MKRKDKKRKANNPTQLLVSLENRRGKCSYNVMFVDDSDKCVNRNTIQDFYIQENELPTIAKLLPIIKNKIHFYWGHKSLRGL
jgi:hypothetical protein